MFVLITSVLLLAAHQGQCLMKAEAILYPNLLFSSDGSVIFTQEDAESPVVISGTVNGLNPNSAHGFHIHVNPVDERGPNCTDAGPHFNPYNTPHGPRTADINNRHVGDLGNITTDENGTATFTMPDSIIQLYNATQSIIHRSVVVHQLRDDAGQGGFIDSNTTGNAGARLLCGLIVLLYDNSSTTTTTTTTTAPPETTTTTTAAPETTTTAAPETTTTTTTAVPETTTTIGNTTAPPAPSTGAHFQPVTFTFMIIMIIAVVMLA